MAVERNATIFDKIDFPKYEYKEFPMAVPVVDGEIQDSPYDAKRKAHPVVIVNNQQEYDDLLAKRVKVVEGKLPGENAHVETDDDIRSELLIQAEQIGVVVDPSWDLERIEKAIQAKAAAKRRAAKTTEEPV